LWLLYERLATLLPHGPRRWVLRRESLLLRDYEGHMCDRFDAVTAVTAEDRWALESVSGGGAAIDVVPIAVDTREILPVARRPSGARVVFVGTMNWPPNADAVTWFARQAWPIVRARRPDAQLDVLGACPPRRVAALAQEGGAIRVVGYVEDLAARLGDAGVFVVPLRAGAGMRVKILDALARGLPIVSTRVGCEGLAVTHERDILIADTAREFAGAVVRVLDDPSLAERLGRNGRALAERVYDYRTACRPLDEIYARMAARSPSRVECDVR
jgi:glycosyltransferase involved in cell wall biosynthesis